MLNDHGYVITCRKFISCDICECKPDLDLSYVLCWFTTSITVNPWKGTYHMKEVVYCESERSKSGPYNHIWMVKIQNHLKVI